VTSAERHFQTSELWGKPPKPDFSFQGTASTFFFRLNEIGSDATGSWH
jgi:hypothetical protein